MVTVGKEVGVGDGIFFFGSSSKSLNIFPCLSVTGTGNWGIKGAALGLIVRPETVTT